MSDSVDAVEWIQRLERAEISSVELTQAYLQRIEQDDSDIGAYQSVFADEAVQQAASIDARRAAGEPIGPLAGLPVAVKDVLCTNTGATTCGSKYLEQYHAPYNATVVERILAADGVLLGKTNMDEFAMGGSGENSAYRVTANPWDRERVPGGSSSGSAACIAADMAPMSIGTDTGGSIRQPAAFCGISGMKPTYGRVSRYGLVAFASSLDQAGPMAWSARDLAAGLQVIAGHDPNDSTSANEPTPDYLQSLEKPIAGMKLGRVVDHFGEGADPDVLTAVEQAMDALRAQGAEIVDVSLPHTKYAIATYYVIAPSEASSNLSRYDGMRYGRRTTAEDVRDAVRQQANAIADETGEPLSERELRELTLVETYSLSRSQGLGPEVQRRIMLGAYALSEGYQSKYYNKALSVRRLIAEDYKKAFSQVDALIGPVTPTAAFKIGEKASDPLAMYLGDLFTVSANLAGVPAVSIPCGATTDGLPIGLHLQGPLFGESQLLQLAHAFQQTTDWHLRRVDGKGGVS